MSIRESNVEWDDRMIRREFIDDLSGEPYYCVIEPRPGATAPNPVAAPGKHSASRGLRRRLLMLGLALAITVIVTVAAFALAGR